MTVAFFVIAEGGKVDKPKVIWKIKKQSCFKRINAASKLKQVSYFVDAKLWMQADIIGKVLEEINCIMKVENWNVLLFLNNAQVHPENLVGKCSNIKIWFLPKNTVSSLQPLDAGTIKNFKVKYRKKLLRHVIARISDDYIASDIAKEVNILQAITWVAAARKEVSETTIKNCFAKCHNVQQVVENYKPDLDDEFAELLKELSKWMEL